MVAGFPPRALFVLADRSPPWAGPHEPTHEGERALLKIRTPQGLWIETLGRVADQQAVHRHRRQTGVIPNRRAAADLDDASAFALSARHEQALPRRGFPL